MYPAVAYPYCNGEVTRRLAEVYPYHNEVEWVGGWLYGYVAKNM